jgi:hypothetical protein
MLKPVLAAAFRRWLLVLRLEQVAPVHNGLGHVFSLAGPEDVALGVLRLRAHNLSFSLILIYYTKTIKFKIG